MSQSLSGVCSHSGYNCFRLGERHISIMRSKSHLKMLIPTLVDINPDKNIV